MIRKIILTHIESGEVRSLNVEAGTYKSLNSFARRELQCPWPEWEARYELLAASDQVVKAAKIKLPKPTIAERAAARICPNCGGEAVRRSPKGPMPTFCDAKGKNVCKREFETRVLVEGRTLAPLLKAWRVDRGSGEIAQKAFTQICQIADSFNAKDHAAGRPRADLYAAKLLANGSLFFDRQSKRPERPERAPQTEEPQQEEQQPDLAAILQMIADGHNDARGLAAQALGSKR